MLIAPQRSRGMTNGLFSILPCRNPGFCLPSQAWQAQEPGHPFLGNSHRKGFLPAKGGAAQAVNPSWNQPCPGCAADAENPFTSSLKLNFLPSTQLPKFSNGLWGGTVEQLPGASGTGSLIQNKSRGSGSAATQQERYLV